MCFELTYFQLVEREMGDSANIRKLLDTKNRELEDIRSANSRLERDLYMLKSSVEQEKSHFSREVGKMC